MGIRKKLSSMKIVLKEEARQKIKKVKNECVSLCLGSVVYSSLEYRFHTLKDGIYEMLDPKELDILYSGTNKI